MSARRQFGVRATAAAAGTVSAGTVSSSRRRTGRAVTAAAVEALEIRRLFTTYAVDTTVDNNDGNVSAGQFSLREAILAANAHPGADEIVLPAGTLSLSIAGAGEDAGATGDLDITDDVTIVGRGVRGSVTTAISAQQLDRVFDIHDATVTLAGVGVTGGSPQGAANADRDGGGIRVQFGTLNLVDSEVYSNTSGSGVNFGGYGGGIYAAGSTLNLERSIVAGNSSGSGSDVGGAGGGISAVSGSVVTLTDSTITSNHTGDGAAGANLITAGSGAGIEAEASALTLVNSWVAFNTAGATTLGRGGGIYLGSGGTLGVDRSLISSNSAYMGGGINLNASTADHITDSMISGNKASLSGGGLRIESGTVSLIERSTFTANLQTGSATDPNAGGGAIYNFGDIGTIVNSTITGNAAAANGGGIMNNGDIATILNVTIAGNAAADGGGVYHMLFSNGTPTIGELTNTLIGDNGATATGGTADFKQLGAVTVAQNNLVESISAPSGTPVVNGVNGNIVGVDAQLVSTGQGGALDGGLTRVRPLSATSPAVDAGLTSAAPATDQRGYARPVGAAADIGSYELEAGANLPPVAQGRSVIVYEDTAVVVIPVVYSDVDTGKDKLTPVITSGPTGGTAQFGASAVLQQGAVGDNSGQAIVYRPNANFSGTDTITYVVTDASGNTSAPATITINVANVNDAPVANADGYSIAEDTSLIVPASQGVLRNDSDADGDPLTAVLVSGAAHGTVVLNADGSFNYRPAPNYNGPDAFSYKASDGDLQSAVVTVALTIAPVNDAPVAAGETFTVAEDTPLTGAVLGNDSDVDGDALTAVLVSGPSHGTLALNADGTFTYTPAANYNGPDGFTYSASDGSLLSKPVLVGIKVTPVNDAPVSVGDTVTTAEDTPISGNVLANDSDVDGDTLSAVLVTGPANGTLALNGDGSFTYRPAANYFGTDAFTYFASDGAAASAVATVTINVSPVNDVPVANRDSVATSEDTAVSGNVLVNDTDADGDSLTATLVNGPSHGTLAFNADGSFLYTPGADFNGSDSFAYTASDGQSTSNIAGVSITVAAVNDAPVAHDDNFVTSEDTAVTVGAPGLLANDTDVDNDALSAVLVAGPSHGSLALNSSGAFTYTPAADFNGSDSFSYKTNDGTVDSNLATVNITVTPVNDAPVARNDSYSLDEDTPLSVAAPGLLSNDFDVDGPGLSAVLVTGPAHGSLALNADGSFLYTPAANYNGPDSFTYAASDGLANSGPATVSLGIRSVNDAPVAKDDAYTVAQHSTLTIPTPGVLANDTDADGDALSAVLVSGPSHGTLALNGDGSFTYTPASNYNGPDAFSYQASDGAAQSGLATVGITVTEVNLPPTAGNDAYTTSEDTPLAVAAPGVLANDADPESSPVTAVLVSGPAHGTLALNSDGSFLYTPAANYNGPDAFTYAASDGATRSGPATVSINVTPVNDAPVAKADAFAGNEDATITGNVLANDTDVDGDALSAAVAAGPAHGTLSLAADGSFVYTPAANYFGADSFTYVTSDGAAQAGPTNVSLTVNPVDDAPVAAGDAATTAEDTPVSGNVLANDTDVDSSGLTAVLVTGPSHGALSLNPDGTFTYTPAANYNGADAFTYRASDGQLASGPATVAITVTPVNDAPTISPAVFAVPENSPAGTAVGTAKGADVDGDVLTYSIAGGTGATAFAIDPASGAITVADPAQLDFETTPSFALDVAVTDPAGLSAHATVTVNLSDVNENALQVDAAAVPNNVVKLKKNDSITVVIYSSATFDARQVDLSTLRFGRTGTEAAVDTDNHGRPDVRYADLNHDRRTDVVVEFTSVKTGLRAGDTSAVLTGQLNDGRTFSTTLPVIVEAQKGHGGWDQVSDLIDLLKDWF